ncbi:hypothetical protein OC861_000448 [Tilletia horrida]|nr:hypothetical protein OC861_000448 [Tilletia horrida]
MEHHIPPTHGMPYPSHRSIHPHMPADASVVGISSSMPLPPQLVPGSNGAFDLSSYGSSSRIHPALGHPSHLSPPQSTVDNLVSPTSGSIPTSSFGPSVEASMSKAQRKELISTFFNRVHPYSALFDEMSFLRDLATGECPLQLWPMFALAARFLPDYSFAAAELYASQARKLLQPEGSQGSSLLDIAYAEYLEAPDARNISHLLAVAQTVLLLSAYEFGASRHQAALQNSSACVRILIGAGLHRSLALASGGQPHELVRSRLVSIAFTHDVVVAAVADQTATVRRLDFETAALAGPTVASSEHAFGRQSPEQRHSSLHERSTSERLTSHLENLARAAGIFAHAFDLRRHRQSGIATHSSVANTMSDEINRQLCEWSDRLEPNQTFNGDNVQRHGSALWAVANSNGAHDWTAEHSIALAWSTMHILCECSSVLSKNSSLAEVDGLRSARSNVVLLLENMHSVGQNSLISVLPILYAQQIGEDIQVDAHQGRKVEMWVSASQALWTLSPVQRRKAVAVLRPPVGSSYRSTAASRAGPANPAASSARNPLSRSLPALSPGSVPISEGVAAFHPGASPPSNSQPPFLGQSSGKRSYSSASATSSTSPHLHSLTQLASPPFSTTSNGKHSVPHLPALNTSGSMSSSSSSTSSSRIPSNADPAHSGTSSAASPLSSATSSEARSPPPPPPVLPVSSAGLKSAAIFKTNVLPPLISFSKHRT